MNEEREFDEVIARVDGAEIEFTYLLQGQIQAITAQVLVNGRVTVQNMHGKLYDKVPQAHT